MPEARDDKQLVALSQVPVGQKALIVAFAVDTGHGERIQQMGLVPGEMVEVVRIQPDHIELKIGRYFVPLNKTEADHIKVRPFF